jgi:hypothetical protein
MKVRQGIDFDPCRLREADGMVYPKLADQKGEVKLKSRLLTCDASCKLEMQFCWGNCQRLSEVFRYIRNFKL